MLLFAETHLGEDELQLAELRQFMRTAGFKFAASAAKATGNGGTHGGTMAAVRKHLQIQLPA